MIKLDTNGLFPAIVQDIKTNEVLMLGYMSPGSLKRTLEGGQVWFYSRSRQELWKKGEISGNFIDFKEAFLDVANEKVSKSDLIPIINVDSILNLEELNDQMIKFLNTLEPYGPGNMRPIFVSNNLSIDGIPKLLGRSHNTLKFSVKQNRTLIESIGFNMADHYEKLIQNSPIDIAYVIGENDWDGQKTIQLELKDIKLSTNYA